MIYEELMFDDSTQKRLRLYKACCIEPKKLFSIHHFIEKLDLNYQQATNIFQMIDEELKEYNPKLKNIQLKNGKIDLRNLQVGLDEYRYFLLQKSIPYLIFQEILNGEELSIEQFCEKYEFSRSTVSRKMINITRFLKKYKIRITYSPLGITGNEMVVRMTLFYIYWLGVKNVEWPFKISRDKVEQVIENYNVVLPITQSYIGKMELSYLFAIMMLRIKKGNFIKENEELKTFIDQNETLKDMKFEGISKQVEKKHECEKYFSFFISHFMPNFSEQNKREIKKWLRYFKVKHFDQPITLLNEQFLLFVGEELYPEIDMETEEVIMANLLNISGTYYVLNSAYPDFEVMTKKLFNNNELYIGVEKKVREFFDEILQQDKFKRFRVVKETLIRRYSNLLVPYLSKARNNKLIKVGIAIEHNEILIQRLRGFLGSLNFLEVENFNADSVEDYDVVITSTTSIQNEFPNLNIYYWDVEFGEKELIYLYQYLQEEYLK